MKETLSQIVARAEGVRVRNAINPLLWLTAVASPLCFLTAGLSELDIWLKAIIVLFGLAPIGAALAAYFILLIREPDRLQSEEYLLRREELLILQKNGEAIDPNRLSNMQNSAMGPVPPEARSEP